MPAVRHARLALLAAAVALVVALLQGSPVSPPPLTPGGVPPEVAAAPTPSARPVTRSQPYAPVPDPDGRRDEVEPARPPSPEVLTGYVWPLPKGRLTQRYGHTPWGGRLLDGRRYHDGIDLATFCGDRIVAAHDGVVLAAGRRFDRHVGWLGDLGPYFARLDEKKAWGTLPIVVVVDDGNGYRSVYAHFRSVVVKAGDLVRAGDLLGHEGATGRASGCHLHYSIFSPLETAVSETRPDVMARMLLPRYQTLRIDPLLVLPPLPVPTASPPPAGPEPVAAVAADDPAAAGGAASSSRSPAP